MLLVRALPYTISVLNFAIYSKKTTFQPMLTSPIDNILVEKAKRQMQLCNGDNVVKTYRISLGKNVGF